MARKQLGASPTNTTDAATKSYVDTSITNLGAVTSTSGTSVDSEIALFSSTTGTVIKRATGSGLAKVTSGVFSTVAAPSGTVVGDSDTQTLTNKNITPRVTSITSSATPTINTDTCDVVTITALAADITSMTTNLSGTPTNFQPLTIRIKDNGTSRAVTWGSSFQSGIAVLPTSTVRGGTLVVEFMYDTVQSKWLCNRTGTVGTVTLDSVGQGGSNNASSVSWTHTASAGAYVIACLNAQNTGTTPTITSATYGGVNMTFLGFTYLGNAGANGLVAVYGMANASAGISTITFTLSATFTTAGNSISYKNVGSVETVVTANSASTTNSQTVSCPAGETVVEFLANQGNGSVSNISSGVGTLRANTLCVAQGNQRLLIFDSTTSSTTFSETLSASDNNGGIAVKLTAASLSQVAYDATGGGYTSTSDLTTINASWSHTAAAGAAVIVAVGAGASAAKTSVTRAVTYGGVSMTSLGEADGYNALYGVELFGLTNVAGGTKTVNLTMSGATFYDVAANSVSYTGVSTFGTAVTNYDTVASMTSTPVYTSNVRQIVVQAFVAIYNSGLVTLSAYNQTSRYSQNLTDGTNRSIGFIMGEAAGAPGVTFTATDSVGGYYGSVAVSLS